MLVFLRGLSNSGAVLLVFTALSLTTVTKTNLLNMTAPVFVFALAPLLNRERSPLLYFLLLIVTMAGSFLVVLSVLREALLWALGGSGCSLVAQTLLTVGYRHVPASEGSLISATRILIAAVLGYLVFGDLVTFRSFVGGSLILGSLATIGVHSRREESRGEEAAVGTPSGI
ncbi:MAG: EamA family transporter [Spirochaetaceae bacterium]